MTRGRGVAAAPGRAALARFAVPALAAALLLLALFAPARALAADVSAAEFRDLAAAAVDDAGALRELRAVDSVDGERVDVDGALRGARGAALDARLRELAAPVQIVPGGDPRAAARDVLAEDRFHGSSVPGPFRGVFGWIGDRLPDVDVPLDWLDDLLPGGRSIVWIVLGALVIGVAVFVARRVLTGRVRVATAAAARAVPASGDPRELERRADAAEAAGDLETALRLRFRAGLLQLDARGAIEFRPSISTTEVRRTLHSDDFDALAATFDDVVYGGRPPEESDVAAARERWSRVVRR